MKPITEIMKIKTLHPFEEWFFSYPTSLSVIELNASGQIYVVY